MKMSTRK